MEDDVGEQQSEPASSDADHGDTDSGGSLEAFRSYLRLLANLQMDKRLQGKLDASDIVQQTMMQAYKARDQFRGENDKQRAAWLRQILARNLMHARRDMTRDKRDVRREQAMQAAIDQTSMRLEGLLAANESSPSMKVQRGEQILDIAKAIERLPEAQREALLMHYLEQKSLADIAEHLDKTRGSVAGLVRRALAALRETFGQTSDAPPQDDPQP